MDIQPLVESEAGPTVTEYTLTNENGVELRTMNYGGTILSLRVPDRDGRFEDVVLGLASYEAYRSEAYLAESPYFGAIIGRFGNRIHEGCFHLNGSTYQLARNHGTNHLHGGTVGFDQRVWNSHPFVDEQGPGIRYTYVSPDGEEGYPGCLEASTTYQLTDDNTLIVSYEATTTKATPVNMTQHTYFNLAGHHAASVLDHRLAINADSFTPVDSTLIPTGAIRSVTGTPFDFRTPTPIGARIHAENQQIQYGQGYDHNFVLNRDDEDADSLLRAAQVYEPDSGRILTVSTTEPGMQFYSGNSLNGTLVGKDGVVYERRSGFCLETQHFPDSPNQPAFPSTILHPGETYRSQTRFSFSTRPRD